MIHLNVEIKQMSIIMLFEEKGRSDVNSILKLHPFVFSKLKKSSESYKKDELKKLLYLFDEYDSKTKIGELDFDIGLKKIICMM